MDFQQIKPIENAESYLDIAFRRAKKRAEQFRGKKTGKTLLQKKKEGGIVRIETVYDNLNVILERIIKSFPSLNNLNPFYQELVRTTLPFNDIKKNLGRLDGARRKIRELSAEHKRRILKEKEASKVSVHWKSCYGRVSSIMMKIKSVFPFLEKVRRTMQVFPVIKDKPTAALFGFPNVGKTTLISKLTRSTPEIQEYAFTTKGINVAYFNGIQLLDTPGTLNRFEKMNMFEKQAWLALEYLSEAVIYVYDPAESFPMAEQKKLFKKIEKLGIPCLVYVSKADLFPEKAENLVKSCGGTTEIKDVKLWLRSLFSEKK